LCQNAAARQQKVGTIKTKIERKTKFVRIEATAKIRLTRAMNRRKNAKDAKKVGDARPSCGGDRIIGIQ
jgi:hypothetical protein